jgi:peptidyl-dipeptidase Dcp
MVHMRDSIARSFVLPFLTVLIGLFIVGSLTRKNINLLIVESAEAQSSSSANANPLLANWSGPYGGVPPFDRVQIAYFKPALEAAMAENLAEVDKIAKNPAGPSFEDTIAELERSGRTLDRVTTVYGVWAGTMASPEFQVVQREMAPKLAAFNDQITQNEALFKRIEAVYNSPAKKKLTAEQQRLTWLYYTNFVRSGAKLGTQAKARLSQINQELAGLFTHFSQNVLAEENDQFILLTSDAELAGLPQSVRDAAAAAAVTKKQTGWLIQNTRSSIDPFLT